MRNHAHDVVLVGAEVEAAVAALGVAGALALPLRKQAAQRNLTAREYAQVAMQRQNILIGLERQRAAYRNSLLPDTRKPLTHLALAQQNQHFFLNQPRPQQVLIEVEQSFVGVVVAIEGHGAKRVGWGGQR